MEQNKARQDHQGLRLPSVLPSMDLNSLSLSQLLSEEALHAALEGVPADAVNKHASEGEDGAGGARDLATPPTALPDLLRRMSANMANGEDEMICGVLNKLPTVASTNAPSIPCYRIQQSA